MTFLTTLPFQENNGNNTVGTSTTVKKPIGSGVAAMAATTVVGIASTSAAVVSGPKKTTLNTPTTGQKVKKTRYVKLNS